MTSLTEQWKKGELPNGMYYIEFKDGDIAKDVYAFGSWGNINEHFLKQVLAEVPSYEEWTASYNCMFDNEVLRLENAQLKDMLKEWLLFAEEENPKDFTVISERMQELAQQTNGLLGEE